MSEIVSLDKEKWNIMRNVADFLNQLVSKDPRRPRYSYIDRLSTPYNQEIILITMQEALREARSADYWVPDENDIEKDGIFADILIWIISP